MGLLRPPRIIVPSTNPFDDNSIQFRFWTPRFWRCLLYDCDAEQWERPVASIIRYYHKILKKSKDGLFLPAGTRLYHGSTRSPFLGGKRGTNTDKITFFGLDAVIAIWFILEEILMTNDPCRGSAHINGILYEFELKNDIKITEIIPLLITNPSDRSIPCVRIPSAVCLHPQISFHGVSLPTRKRDIVPLFDLCSEVTLRYSHYHDSMRLVKIHHVDPVVLFDNADKPGFDPVHAIVPRPKYPPTITCKRLATLFDQKKT